MQPDNYRWAPWMALLSAVALAACTGGASAVHALPFGPSNATGTPSNDSTGGGESSAGATAAPATGGTTDSNYAPTPADDGGGVADASDNFASADAGAADSAAGDDAGNAGDAGRSGGSGGTSKVFAGAGAYNEQKGHSTGQLGHVFLLGNSNPAGHACLDCHNGSSLAPVFVMAGTVTADATGHSPAAGAEVRVLHSDGTATSTFTDQNGNFFIEKNSSNQGRFDAQLVGVRNDATTIEMPTMPTSGNCNACHSANGGPPAIHL